MTDDKLQAKIVALGLQYNQAAELLVKLAHQHKFTPETFRAVVMPGGRSRQFPGVVKTAAVKADEIFELRAKLQMRLVHSLFRQGVCASEIADRADLKLEVVQEVIEVLRG